MTALLMAALLALFVAVTLTAGLYVVRRSCRRDAVLLATWRDQVLCVLLHAALEPQRAGRQTLQRLLAREPGGVGELSFARAYPLNRRGPRDPGIRRALALPGARAAPWRRRRPRRAAAADGPARAPERRWALVVVAGDHAYAAVVHARDPRRAERRAFEVLLRDHGAPRGELRHWALVPLPPLPPAWRTYAEDELLQEMGAG